MKYLLNTPTARKTPQSQAIPGREGGMVRNNAGGYAFTADSWTRLERFLILGSQSGSYYVGERDLTKENVDNVRACIAADGVRAVRTIVDISVSGRAPKNDPALYALALAASCCDVDVREYALSQLSRVARIGTHLFTFCAFIDGQRGWGPALRRALASWYVSKPVDKLAYQLCKYQNRNGWTHRDVLRLCHAKPPASHVAALRWAVKGEVGADSPAILQALEKAKTASERELVSLIVEFGLTREMVPTEHQKSPKVWEALLEKMPLTAMIRTLGRMGSVGLLVPFSSAVTRVVCMLDDGEALRQSRVHPIQVLAAILTYGQGRGQKGSLTWTPVPQVMDALDRAFYKAFANVEPTGKRFYLGIDVSGSMMHGSVAGLDGLTPNMGAAAMAMLIARTEPNYFVGGFATSFVDLGITAADTLTAAMRKCQRSFGGTDCAVAVKHALDNRYPVDAFVVITDGETWAGARHNSQALEEYRQRMGVDAKLAVIGMVPNATSIADPLDAGSIDICGFDASVPAVLAGFVGGRQAAPSSNEV